MRKKRNLDKQKNQKIFLNFCRFKNRDGFVSLCFCQLFIDLNKGPLTLPYKFMNL